MHMAFIVKQPFSSLRGFSYNYPMAKPASKKTIVPTHRTRLFFTGRVQGVGFRHTAEEIALSLGLLGWVRNLHDDRVEILAEGSKELLEEFIEKIQASHLGRHIKKCQCIWEKPSGEFSDFCVEFCL